MNLTRREAIKSMAILMGASVVGPRLLAGAFGTGTTAGFSATDLALLDEIGETIIPATNIPGAKAVGIGGFIAMMVNDCYTVQTQAAFKAGLTRLTRDYRARYNEDFTGGQQKNRLEFLGELDREQRKHTAENRQKTESYESGKSPDEVSPHFFRVLRDLTVLGYFSSEVGSTQAVHYLEVPGRYDGNVPYKKGDPTYT